MKRQAPGASTTRRGPRTSSPSRSVSQAAKASRPAGSSRAHRRSPPLNEAAGREAFAAWLTDLLGDDVRGPRRVVEAPESWRFTDHPLGHVSIINLNSVRDLGQKMGAELDPLRFRANLYVDGWPAWAELGWEGKALMLGWARAEVFKPIVRCLATHVDPATAERDQEVTKALFDNYGHLHCGIYVRVTSAEGVGLGDAVAPGPRRSRNPGPATLTR